jgi:cyclopropane fatty-acyl-phospholipid synthase-like methyltransferase
MYLKDTDKDWEYFGRTDPYFSAFSYNEYRKEKISPESRERFFETGSAHVAMVFDVMQRYVDAHFQPGEATILDFGCGVARLVIPFARVCKHVTGVDISASMLREARNNCQEHGLSNVDLVNDLDDAPGPYDFIHSYIVLQHIPVPRGEMVVRRLIGLLRENGVGMLHLTYYRRSESFGSRVRNWLYAHCPTPLFAGFRNLLRGMPIAQPVMQMNEYDLNRIFRMFQEAGCQHSVVRFTRHWDTDGVMVFFQRKAVGVL